jgi:aconitate decarboxylase
MDFDDTWHPATHPSGAVLPVLTALAEALPESPKFSGLDLLLAFNVGIEVQGRLLQFSKEARDIPKRYGQPCPLRSDCCPSSVSLWLSLQSFLAEKLALLKMLTLVPAAPSTLITYQTLCPYTKVWL